MAYIVISLCDGTHTVHTELPKSVFRGMDCVESEEAIVWRDKETIIVQYKE